MVCNRCGAGIPPGYAWCFRCGAWTQAPPSGWPYAQPGYYPGQATVGQMHYVPGYDYQQQPAAPGARWPIGYGYSPQEGQKGNWRAAVRCGAPLIYSLITFACGFAVILSTFLPWASMLSFSVSGWSMMSNVAGSNNGNFLFSYGEGMLVFTGFWSLLMGAVILAGMTLMLSGMRFGERISQVAGALGLGLSGTTTVMLYTHNVSTGIGLWAFMVFSAASVILAQLTMRAAFSYDY